MSALNPLLLDLPLLAAGMYLLLLVVAFSRRGPRAAQLRWLLAFLMISIAWELVVFLQASLALPVDLGLTLLLLSTTTLGAATAVFQEQPHARRWLLIGTVLITVAIVSDWFLGSDAYGIAWLILSGSILAVIWRDYRRTPYPWHANRLLLWGLAVLVTFLGEALLIANVPVLQLIGQPVRFLGVLGLTYSVVSYRPFDIRTRTQRGLAFVVTTAVSALPVLGAVLLILRLPQDLPTSVQLLLTVGLVLVGLLLYNPFSRFIGRITERYLFGERINTNQVVRRYSQSIATTLDMQQLALVIFGMLNGLLQIERGALLLVTRDGDSDEAGFVVTPVQAMGQIPRQERPFPANSHFLQLMQEDRQPLLQYEIDFNPAYAAIPLAERAWLQDMGMEVYVPIYAHEQLDGVLAVGPKRSGGTFQQGELDLLQTLADQTAVALQNARLFSELGAQNERIRELNISLVGQNERLERMDHVKTDFITIASHELRTPLTQVKGYADILNALSADNALTPQQLQEIMAYINRATQQLERIIGAMLDASQLEIDGVQLSLSSINLETVVEAAAAPLRHALRERQISLTLHDLDALPNIEADGQRLEQAIANILGNAVKYTPDRGRIMVSGAPIPSANGEGNFVELVISDTGIGIDPQYHELIFEKFFRVDNPELHSTGSTKFKGAGPGLGLHIARGVIEAHNGRIWVESSGEDEARLPGSSFHIVLPVRQTSAAANGTSLRGAREIA